MAESVEHKTWSSYEVRDFLRFAANGDLYATYVLPLLARNAWNRSRGCWHRVGDGGSFIDSFTMAF